MAQAVVAWGGQRAISSVHCKAAASDAGCPQHCSSSRRSRQRLFMSKASFAGNQPVALRDWMCKTPSIQVFRRPARKIPVQCQSTADVAPEAQPALVGGQLDVPPPGCSRVKLTLGKPLGIVLEEDKAGNIFIAEVFPEGNAFKSGLVDAGDQLIAVSAVVYNTSEKYGEVEVRKGQEKVRLNVRGESFKTVMAAIGSHPAYIKVDLEIQKCEPVNSGSNNGS